MALLKSLDENLIFINKNFENKNIFFEFIEQQASKCGYIKNGYAEALSNREENYPTGLQLNKNGVAIPHTDTKFIKKEFISLITFETPLLFKSMEDSDKKIEVKAAFILGLKDPNSQLETLQQIVEIIQNEEVIDTIIHAKEKNEIINVLL